MYCFIRFLKRLPEGVNMGFLDVCKFTTSTIKNTLNHAYSVVGKTKCPHLRDQHCIS